MRSVSNSELVERALAVPGADAEVGRVVLVRESSEAVLRWANSTMTTNGHTCALRWSVISLLAVNGGTAAGVVSSSARVDDPAALEAAVCAAAEAARQTGPARDVAALPEPADLDRTDPTGPAGPAGETAGKSAEDPAVGSGSDWAEPAAETSITVFAALADQLAQAFAQGRGRRLLYGFASHRLTTTWLGTSTGVRRRGTVPTGSIELNAKTADLARSAWGGRPVATAADWAGLDLLELDQRLATRLAWGRRRVALPAGRYPTVLPPSCVADLLTYTCWEMTGRTAQEGRSPFAGKIGSRLTPHPLTLTSDPRAGLPDDPGLATLPFLATAHSGDQVSVFDNGAPLRRVNWITDGTLTALAYPRAAAVEFGAEFAAPAENLMLTGGSSASTQDLVAGLDRGLLLTCLWYIRMVDPVTLLLTGLTRDGVYLVEGGEVVGEVNNFRFNESPLELLRRTSAVGAAERTLPREFKDWLSREVMPPMLVGDFNMSSVSEAS